MEQRLLISLLSLAVFMKCGLINLRGCSALVDTISDESNYLLTEFVGFLLVRSVRIVPKYMNSTTNKRNNNNNNMFQNQ